MRFGRSTFRLVAVAGATALFLSLAPEVGAGRRSALGRRPFTVVAAVDTGINPYHLDFRRPELTAHPSTYIEGFPKDAPALRLSLGAKSLSDALARDRAAWDAVDTDELVWIPGTNIIGAIDVVGYPDAFRDTAGHGTGVASIAGGAIHGPGSENVLIVAVSSFTEGLTWAARQPWIDFITNSWTTFDAEPVVEGAAVASRQAVATGKVVCFASGNLSAPLWFTGEQGPSWHVNVGAASGTTRGEHYYTGWPNDVLGIANVKAADNNSIDGEIDFGGTSAATPHVCGLMARTLSEVRAEVGDFVQGPQRKALAAGRGFDGYLDDGILTNYELIDAVQATAVPAEPNPPDPNDDSAIPSLPVAPWVRGGYGIVDRKSIRDALEVLLGLAARPDRTYEDAWIEATDEIRNAIWGDPP